MKNLKSAALILPAFLQPCLGFVPSSIEKTVYKSQAPGDHFTSRTYLDGLGREIRTVVEEGDGDVVSGIEYDDAGRPVQTLKPFYSTVHGHGWNGFDYNTLLLDAHNYYSGATPEQPDAGGYPYSETVYLRDPLKKAKEMGSPGAVFRVGAGHSVKKWYIGSPTADFVPAPTEANLNTMVSSMGAKYVLEVTKDADNRFTQIVKDNLGRVVKTVSDPNIATIGDEIVTENVYDASGRLVRTLLPGPGGAPDPNMVVNYTYRSDGKLIEESYPDEGTSQYLYDAAGRLRLKADSRNSAETGFYKHMTYYKYDMHGRKIEEGWAEYPSQYSWFYFSAERLSDPDFPADGLMAKHGLKRWYYDDFSKLDPFLTIPSGVDLSPDPEARGKLVASVAYNNPGWDSYPVMKFFRYDKEGRVEEKAIVIPGVPVQFFSYQYDLQGRVILKEHMRQAPNAPPYSWTEYTYDNKGRMISAVASGGQGISYAYEPTGKLKRKDVGPIITEERTYNIRDWLKSKEVYDQYTMETYFSQDLQYEDAQHPNVPQYSGNVSTSYFGYYTQELGQFLQSYAYDGANRLVGMSSSTTFQEAFTYDAKGRILTKREDGVTMGPYDYYPGRNRVFRIAGDPLRSNPAGNFFYDARGNMIYDRSKKMAVFYDYANMPYRFQHYNTDPAPGDYHTHTDLNTMVEMLYDADGQRAAKRVITFTDPN